MAIAIFCLFTLSGFKVHPVGNKKGDDIVIQGLDPVLEIVKVFNRAYKLHTTQVIPTGRSGGKVSNK